MTLRIEAIRKMFAEPVLVPRLVVAATALRDTMAPPTDSKGIWLPSAIAGALDPCR
ncbi:hypothetical protein [Mangrovicoccus ximenensis]|uniref:hypothetical protein n=1 Tax=Mangrovicoccus ximenensis TaxID=1911570 RepID=UPI001374B5D2|nr:hypothetical protein [Mangrovicoccus ximenensis]